MAKNFEELIVWQEARILANNVHSSFIDSKDYAFRDQINRAAISIMNNIAEGFERFSKPDFKRFLQFAKASCSEVRSMLYLAIDFNYIDETKASEMMQLGIKIKAEIINLMKKL
jgi:four helix bundle protein